MGFSPEKFACAGLAAAIALAACDTDYTLGKEDPRFGEPNGLEGKNVPGARGEIVTGGECVAPDVACTVKFSTDILAPMIGAWGCGEASCHGSSYEPHITRDAQKSYKELQGWKNIDSTPYVNACSHDPQFSKILCNVTPGDSGACGHPMPPSGNAPLDDASRTALETWVKCGAPFN